MTARSIATLCNNHGSNYYYTDRGGLVGIPAGAGVQWYKISAGGFNRAHRTQTAEGAARKRLYP